MAAPPASYPYALLSLWGSAATIAAATTRGGDDQDKVCAWLALRFRWAPHPPHWPIKTPVLL